MRAINLKLFRELWHIRMQMLSIALVVATGIMCVLGMRGSYDSMLYAQDSYYLKTRFADVWAPLVRAPEALTQRIALIPGVEVVDTRITFLATLDLPEVSMPAQGRFVSLPEFDRPALNDIQIIKGRYIVSGAPDEVIISEKFALARQLLPGDSIKVVINGRSQQLTIVGIANSPEYSYALPPGALLPENDRFGIFWMSREFLGPAYDMDGAFNELVVRLNPQVNSASVLREIDLLLDPYGGLGSYLRKDQASHQIVDSELTEMQVMGTIIPGIFLLVAVFLLHLVLGRVISTQRNEIAVLKAFGYSRVEIGMHYLAFAWVAVLAGAVVGAAGGVYFGGGMIGLYAQYFDIPALEYRLTPSLLVISVLISMAGAGTGSWSAIKKALDLPPAEAMQPPSPARFSAGPLERLGLGSLLPAAGRMILRNIERKPVQALLSAVGVAMSLAILVVGMFMFDSINYLIDLQFRGIQREDLMITFKEKVPDSVRFELDNFAGVSLVETFRVEPARLFAGHRKEEVAIQALEENSQMRRILNEDGIEIPLAEDGLVLSSLLAKRLQVNAGDEIRVQWLDGKRLQNTTFVSGIVDDFIGIAVYMSTAAMNKHTGDSDLVSGALLRVDAAQRNNLYTKLKETPGVAGVASPETMVETFNEEMAKTMTLSISFLLGFACVIAMGVIYNGARISLSERGRELASLRVMGFHKTEVSTLLLGEQAIITVLALPLGCWIGYGISQWIVGNIETDTYRVPFVPDPRTFVIACGIILVAAVLSGLAVRQRLNRIGLIEVLKTRE